MMANITRNVPSAGRSRNAADPLGQLLGLRACRCRRGSSSTPAGIITMVTSADSQISGNW